jgi:YVTN family beta-propeller protein
MHVRVASVYSLRMRNTLLAAALLAMTLPASTQTTTLLALSKHDHTLSVIDPSTLQTLYKLPVGPDPHEVIASTDGTTAYVSNYGFGSLHTIAVLDLVHHQALPSIDVSPLNAPHGLAFAAGKLYFTSEVAKAIGRYDPSTQKIDWVLGTGQNRIHMVDVSPDVQHIVATNVTSATVSIINMEPVPQQGPPPGMHMGPPPGLASPQTQLPPSAQDRTDWNETVVPVGHGSEGFDFSPDRKEIWVANAQDGTLSVIDYASKKVVATLHADVRSANRLKFTPDGKHVLVSLLGSPDLVILDPSTRTVTQRIPIGHGAAGILIDPTNNRAFVACTPDNSIAVIDLHTFKVTDHIPNIPEPDGMAWATTP